MTKLKMKYENPEDLNLATYNPRVISKRDFEALKRSILEFGFVDPVVVNKDGTVIGGNQRVKAALDLELEKVPTVRVDVNKIREKALNVALNKIHGDWDEVALGVIFQEIMLEGDFDMDLTGFTDQEVADILESPIPSSKETVTFMATKEKRVKCPGCGEEFNPSEHKVVK